MKTKRTKKKPNVQDATLRNVRALKKHIRKPETQILLIWKTIDGIKIDIHGMWVQLQSLNKWQQGVVGGGSFKKGSKRK